jgi:hypothetical protein
MAVVDLSRRVTQDQDEYTYNKRSKESLVFVRGGENIQIQSDTTFNITVGEVWYNSERHADTRIGKKGIRLKPQKYIVLKTEQYLAIPYNVCGIVVGKGNNIFNGGVISTGKIVPGYKGELRIGYYNAGSETIILHKGDLLGSCIFFDTEATLIEESIDATYDKVPVLEYISRRRRIWELFLDNWYKIFSLLFSLAAIVVSLLS